MNGRVGQSAAPPAVGSQKRKRGLVPTKEVQYREKDTLPVNGFGTLLAENITEDKTLCCVLCGNKNTDLIDLAQHTMIRQTVMAFADIPAQSIEGVRASVCGQCIVKLNVQQDIKRQMKEKIKRLVNGQAKNSMVFETEATNNISAKKVLSNCPKAGKRKTHASPSSTNGCQGDKLEISIVTPTSPRNCIPTSTDNTEQMSPQEDNRISTSLSPLVRSTGSPSSSPLVRRYSNELLTLPDSATKSPPTAPAPAVTQIIAIEPPSLSHSISPNVQNQPILDVVYERKEPALFTESGGKINKYDKHPPRHAPQQFVCKTCQRNYQRKHYYSKHVRRCRSRAQFEARSLRAKSMCESVAGGESRQYFFYCNKCPVSVDSQAKLRNHKRIHLTRFYCPTCGQEFNAQHDFEFHCVECLAKHSLDSNGAKTSFYLPERRMTRARSRAASMAASHFDRHHRPSENFSSHISDYDVENEDKEEEDDETFSLADTMYTHRMDYTDNWLQEQSKSLCDDAYVGNFNDFDECLNISSDKEYDLYLLDRLKKGIALGTLSCFVPFCKFRGNSGPHLMLHEFCDHYERLMFHCKKCGESFTRKVFLDFHLYCQNGGRYICYKCGDVFEFQDQLDRHFIRHTKCINYRCNFCNFEFLTKAELLDHCGFEQHDPNGERELISIVRSMTISNPVPLPPTETPRQYSVRIMEMNLPKIRFNHPLDRPFRRPKAGDLRFKGQEHPNCCSCLLYVKDFEDR